MATFQNLGSALSNRLQNFCFALIGATAFAFVLAGTAAAEEVDTSADLDPPSVVIDAEYTPTQIAAYVVYVRGDHELLAVDSTTGAIRAVMPAPARPIQPAPSSLSSLTAGSVTVQTFDIVLLVAAFMGMAGLIFLRRPPADA